MFYIWSIHLLSHKLIILLTQVHSLFQVFSGMWSFFLYKVTVPFKETKADQSVQEKSLSWRKKNTFHLFFILFTYNLFCFPPHPTSWHIPEGSIKLLSSCTCSKVDGILRRRTPCNVCCSINILDFHVAYIKTTSKRGLTKLYPKQFIFYWLVIRQFLETI